MISTCDATAKKEKQTSVDCEKLASPLPSPSKNLFFVEDERLPPVYCTRENARFLPSSCSEIPYVFLRVPMPLTGEANGPLTSSSFF